MANRDEVIVALETILDPDVNVDIWTMGLVYEISIKDDKNIKLLMTLTSPACPMGPLIEENVKTKMLELGFLNTEIEITFEPAWQPPAALKEALGLL